MKKFFSISKKLFLSLFLSSLFCAYSESFRVARVHAVELPQNYDAVKITSGIFDGISVRLPADSTFITGIEINIKVPQAVAAWRDTVAYLFYENLEPSVSEANIDYSGNRISVNTLPGRLNHTIYVPLNSKFSVKESPYAKTLEVTPALKDNAVFFRFILAMKGAPESLEHSELEISVSPVLSDEGYFFLSVSEPDNKKEPYSVYIDDQLISNSKDKILLATGEHHLSVTSEAFRNEVRTFIVEQAKTTKLNVELRGVEPTVKIISPENARVYFDGQPVDFAKNDFIVSTGSHTVKFVIGDYEIVKTLNAVNGRSYTVNLNVDASISEED